MSKIKRALISLSDKQNLKPLLNCLKKYNIQIISSGGTFKAIKKLKFKCIEVSDFTNSPEILDGRVKTLHPKIHAGILNMRRDRHLDFIPQEVLDKDPKLRQKVYDYRSMMSRIKRKEKSISFFFL